MRDRSESHLEGLKTRYGALYGCQLDFASFLISHDAGEFVIGNERYEGYAIGFGTSHGPTIYSMVGGSEAINKAVNQNALPSLYQEISWGPDDENWSPGHTRLVNRLRRLKWTSFVGGETVLPTSDSPVTKYPGDGGNWTDEIIRPDPAVRTAEEQLYIEDASAWHQHVGFPCATAGWNLWEEWSETHDQAYFLGAMHPNGSPSSHPGPIDKIAHLYDDPTQDQFLGFSNDARSIFDEFTGYDLIPLCVMTRHRASTMRLSFSDGRFVTFERLPVDDKSYGYGIRCSAGASDNPADHSCCQANFRVTTDDESIIEVVTYDQLVEAIETWPLPGD